MRVFSAFRRVFVFFSVFSAAAYLLLYLNRVELLAPLSVCVRFPVFLFYALEPLRCVLYGVLVAAALVLTLLSLWRRFEKKWYIVALPILTLCFDIYGQLICYGASFAADKELLEAYYYFNGIVPTPSDWFLIMGGWDVLLILSLLAPFFVRRKKKKKSPPAAQEGITTDNWEEIIGDGVNSGDAAVDE